MIKRRKTLPALSPKAPVELRPLFAAMMEILETGEGIRGDKLDRKLTLRDMLDGGLANLRVPGNPDSGITAPDGPQNMAVPPRPLGFAADGSFFGMNHLSWEPPSEQYNNHSITNIYRNETDNFATAAVIGREPGMFYSDTVRNDVDIIDDPTSLPGYYYWITFTTTSNIEGPPNSSSGTFARPLPDTAYLLGQLSGKLGESELDKVLGGRIDKIDGPATMPGSVAQRLSVESAARAQALKDQNTSIIANIEAERDARIAAIAGGLDSAKGYADAKIAIEQTARADTFEALTLQIEQIEAGLGDDYTVGMAIEKQARISGDIALASRIDTMTAYAEGVAADLVTERQVRSSKDSALASDITALYVESGDLKTSISNEAQARINGDTMLGSIQQVISAANAVGSAALKVSSEVFINENESMASKTESLRVSTGASVAAIENKLQALTNVDTAQAQRIDQLKASTDTAAASIRSDMLVLAGIDEAQSQRMDSIESEVGDAKTSIQNEAVTRAEKDLALAQQANTLRADLDTTSAAVRAETQARSTAIESLAGQVGTVQASADRAIVKADSALERLTIADTRNDNRPPSWYWTNHPKRVTSELKLSTVMGLPSTVGTYVNIETLVPWTDASGGDIIQTAIIGDGQKNAQRRSTSTTGWSTWQFHTEKITAAVQVVSQAVAAVDGKVSAQHTIQLDVNGYVSGYGSYNDGTTADFAVLADRFWIAQPGKPNSATKPFMVINGVNYLDTAVIRDGSIESGKLGPITFGKIFDDAGNPITTVGGKLRADMIDVDQLQVGDANISGVIQSSQVAGNGRRKWRLDKNGGLEINGSDGGGRMEIRDTHIKVFDGANRLRVQLGKLNI